MKQIRHRQEEQKAFPLLQGSMTIQFQSKPIAKPIRPCVAIWVKESAIITSSQIVDAKPNSKKKTSFSHNRTV
jgi:hypothetical protein